MSLTGFDPNKFQEATGANRPCESCGHPASSFLLLDNDSNTTAIPTIQGSLMPTYTFFCTNCGSARQFIRGFVDQKMKGAEE